MRSLLWGGPQSAATTLADTLARLGMTFCEIASLDPLAMDPGRDILFVDGDLLQGGAMPRDPLLVCLCVPSIGLVGVEAPSRLKALSDFGVTALLRKPVHAGTVYSALFLAVNAHNRLRALEQRLAGHEARRQGPRFVIKAVVVRMQATGQSDDEVYAQLRREAMRLRLSVEDYALRPGEPRGPWRAPWCAPLRAPRG